MRSTPGYIHQGITVFVLNYFQNSLFELAYTIKILFFFVVKIKNSSLYFHLISLE